MSANPVLRALERVKLDAQAVEWERREAALRTIVVQRLGGQPSIDQSVESVNEFAVFRAWCESYGVRHLPAQPASVAQFVLEQSLLGVKSLVGIVASISDTHASLDLPNPVATRIVARAMERAGDIAPPRSWPGTLKAQFLLMPPVLKRYVADHDAQREKVLRRAQNEAARAKRALDAARPDETTTGEVNGKQEPQ